MMRSSLADHASDWRAPGPRLKVSASGYALYADLHADGSVTERAVGRWDDCWHGTWRAGTDSLEITVRGYRLVVPAGSVRGLEVDINRPSAQPTSFAVFRVVDGEQAAVPRGHRVGVVKVTGGRSMLAELHPRGIVREYDLVAGWGRADRHGNWRVDSERLSLDVAGYRWRQIERRAVGYTDGREFSAAGAVNFPIVWVDVDPIQTQLPIGTGNPSSEERLFRYDGYDFFAPNCRSHGFWASVLQARRRSVVGGDQLFAAKCTRPEGGRAKVAHREIAIAEQVSATDGLIAVFGSFELPKDPEFGAFGGAIVHLLEWGETDLERHVKGTGPMRTEAVLRVARDLSAALDALHTKFGFVHSDVRPANVIGRRTGSLSSWRLADFNVTTVLDSKTGRAPFFATSDICCSPGLHSRLRQRERTTIPPDDIWALGTVLVQCILGTVMDIRQRITSAHARELVEELTVPAELRELVGGALDVNTSQRWTAARIHHAAIQQLLAVPT